MKIVRLQAAKFLHHPWLLSFDDEKERDAARAAPSTLWDEFPLLRVTPGIGLAMFATKELAIGCGQRHGFFKPTDTIRIEQK